MAPERPPAHPVRGPRALRRPLRHVPARQPAKAGGREALARVAKDNGTTLIEMAVAFALNHPAVSAVLIGPRTLGHLETELSAAEVALNPDVLDRIDAIVTPGTVINPADMSFTDPALEPAARRRRPLARVGYGSTVRALVACRTSRSRPDRSWPPTGADCSPANRVPLGQRRGSRGLHRLRRQRSVRRRGGPQREADRSCPCGRRRQPQLLRLRRGLRERHRSETAQ
ncbi:aldo/keto reductase [Streptomyces muensis]|uniref:aldo/keto reductase n=1 Tax=Streptomyces muensis TaxID=1077944 RepID=UPI003558D180